MARALKNPAAAPTYLEFFDMNRPPFARVSDPNQLFHAEQYSLLYAHLCSATERAGHLLVLSGAEGSGKTTLLNRYIASLDHETSFATFDENCSDPNAFYCGLLRQLGFKDLSGSLSELRHIAREFLLHRGRAGDPVLVIIDNAQLVSPSVLEQLRWLADITVQDKNVISLVLSGNAELSRIMASPAMSLLNLANRIDFSIRVFSEQETDDYVRHRLRLAGGSESAKLVRETRSLIHRFSGGNPRRINQFCNALLTEALAQETRIIDEAFVRKVADEQEFLPHVLPVAGKGRRKSDKRIAIATPEAIIEERISHRESPPEQAAADFSSGVEPKDVDVNGLLSQVNLLTDELDATRARAEKVLLDVDARDSDIRALIGKIEQQAKELEKAERKARNSDAELKELKHTIQQSEQQAKELEKAERKARNSDAELQKLKDAIQQSEQHAKELQKDLKTEKSAAKKVQSELAKANRKLQRLEQRKADLQESVRELKGEQKQSTSQSRSAQKAQEKKITELEQCVADLQEESELLRARADEADRLEEAIAAKESYLKELQGEIDEYVDELTATQVQLASDMTGMHSIAALPDADAYVGPITAIAIFRGGEPERVVTLQPDVKRLMVGRGADSEICLQSKFVSRHHALIFLSGDRAYIEDLRSYNGTIINGTKATRCDLEPEDKIMIGDFELRPRRG